MLGWSSLGPSFKVVAARNEETKLLTSIIRGFAALLSTLSQSMTSLYVLSVSDDTRAPSSTQRHFT